MNNPQQVFVPIIPPYSYFPQNSTYSNVSGTVYYPIYPQMVQREVDNDYLSKFSLESPDYIPTKKTLPIEDPENQNK